MKHLFIVNPIAGGTSKQGLIERIEALAAAMELQHLIHITTAPGDAERFVREYAKANEDPLRVYSCGGDGTLNEIVNGLRGLKHAELAVHPIGSGNDFVRNFESSERFLDLRALAEGESRSVDLVAVNNRLAINLVNVGLDAVVARNMAMFRGLSRFLPKLVYPLAVVASIFRPVNQHIEVAIDYHPYQDRHLAILVVANGSYYGGGFFAAPYAVVDDGALELCIMERVRHLELPHLLTYYKRGEHLNHPSFEGRLHYQRVRSLKLRSRKPFPIALDGETMLMREALICVVPGAIRVVMPAGVRFRRLLQLVK